MLTGDEIRLRRQLASMTQADLARAVGVSVRSIGNYERGETVPRNKMPLIEEALAHPMASDLHEQPSAPALGQATDAQLLAEIARRFARGQESDGTATTDAGGTPAHVRDFPERPLPTAEEFEQMAARRAELDPGDEPYEDHSEAPDAEGPEGGA